MKTFLFVSHLFFDTNLFKNLRSGYGSYITMDFIFHHSALLVDYLWRCVDLELYIMLQWPVLTYSHYAASDRIHLHIISLIILHTLHYGIAIHVFLFTSVSTRNGDFTDQLRARWDRNYIICTSTLSQHSSLLSTLFITSCFFHILFCYY